ncbi:MAG TPA: hypothetical protein VFU76_14025 [Terriglobales bacterium]|nr:hypothetical protein [Terriglobales bacterium]
MSDNRKLDDLLDRGLREYSQAEPRPGLEDRILANLRTQPEPRPRWRIWIPALAAAAAIIVIVALALRPHEQTAPSATAKGENGPRATSRATVATAMPPREKTAPHVSTKHAPVVAHQRRARTVQVASTGQPSLPRQQTFPAPAPLTEQEKLVMALLRHAPDQARQVAQFQETERARTDSFLRTGELPDAPGPDTRSPQ